jgi:hypothetical protein
VQTSKEEFKELRCMSFTLKGMQEILVAGAQDVMFKVDAEKGTVTETVRSIANQACSKLTSRRGDPNPGPLHYHEAWWAVHLRSYA